MEPIEVHIGTETYAGDQLVSIPIVAEFLGLSVRTVQDMASRREIPVHKLGRAVRVRILDLVEWINQRKVS